MLGLSRSSVRSRSEQGSILMSVIVMMLVLMVLSLTLAAMVTTTTGSAVNSRSLAQSRAAADAGMAALVAHAMANPNDFCGKAWSHSSPRYDVVMGDCVSERVTFTSTGFDAEGNHPTVVEATYGYDSVPSIGTVNGAIVSGKGSLSVTSIRVSLEGGMMLNQGYLNCNNISDIDGNLVIRNPGSSMTDITNSCKVRGSAWVNGNFNCDNWGEVGGNLYVNGTARLSNNCRIGGSLFATGAVTMTNSSSVGGDLITGGNASLSKGTIGGNLLVAGNLTVSDGPATVLGTVVARGTGNMSFNGLTAGSLRVAGHIEKLEGCNITGDVESAKTGSISTTVFPSTRIGGSLKLGGTMNTWSPGPTILGTTQQNVTGITVPSVTVPDTTPPGFEWIELQYNPDDWDDYTPLPTPTCDFQNVLSGVTAVNNRTTPTVFDATSCSSVKFYNATFNLRTDVVFIVKKADAQQLKLTSADGYNHNFAIVVSDNTPSDHAPTCDTAAGQGEVTIYNANTTSQIAAMVYSPCTVRIGGSGNTWNGQVYAGTVAWNGSSMHLEYRQVSLPGLQVAGGAGGGGSGKTLGSLISRRDR